MMILNPWVIFNTALSYFEAVFDTTKTSAGSSDANTITLPLTNMDGLVIDWGDGEINSLNNHTYIESGVKTVKIEGNINGWRFNSTGDRLKLLEIKNWGDFFISGNSTFFGCANLTLDNVNGTPTIATPDLSNTFRECSVLTTVKNINSWEMSSVTSIARMFENCVLFNQSLNMWDVSNVINMRYAFYSARAFNGNITGWDVSNVNDMSFMFTITNEFNQNISAWNVKNVTNMQSMFQNAISFNQPIGFWDMRKVQSIQNMFTQATVFNQNIGAWQLLELTNASIFMNTKTPITFSATNLDAIYNGWSANLLKSGVAISFGSAKYTSAGQAGRDILTTTYGWTITDGGI